MSERNELGIKLVTALVLLVASIAALYITLPTMAEIYNEQIRKENTITTQTIKLASLDCATEIEGELYGFGLGLIGCVNGSISESSCYVAYQVHEDGGKSLYKIPANIAILYDVLETGEAAYAEVDKNGYGEKKQIRVYVPIGTVPQEYNVAID